MQISLRRKRISIEISYLLVPQYGRDNLKWDPDDYNWIWIKRFRLPKGWINKRSDNVEMYGTPYTPLLLEIPAGYPNVAPQNFYAEKQLKCGTDFIFHYFDKPGTGIQSQNRYTDKGWAWLCIKIESWEFKTNFARGDNLRTVCNLIYDILSDKQNATRNYYHHV